MGTKGSDLQKQTYLTTPSQKYNNVLDSIELTKCCGRKGRKAGTYPLLSGEKVETETEIGTGLTGHLADFLHFLHYGYGKP